MSKYLALALVPVLLVFSCQKETRKGTSDARLLEYSNRYSNAITSSDRQYVEATIKFIDDVIGHGGSSDIASIYYNKAQLLFRLGRNDEAIAALQQSKRSYDSFYLGTLYLRLGRIVEGNAIVRENLQGLRKTIWDPKTDKETRQQAFENAWIDFKLIDEDGASFRAEVVSDRLLSDEETRSAAIERLGARAELLESLWPR